MNILSKAPTFLASTRKVLLAAALMIGGTTVAKAGVFGGTASFNDATTGNALNVTATPNPFTFLTGNLAVGGSQFFNNFITLHTTDTQGGLGCIFGCTSSDQVALSFSWSAPGVTNSSMGGTASQTDYLIANFNNGSLTWAGTTLFDLNGFYVEQLVTFADGAKAYVDLYNTTFSGGSTSQTAQIDMRIRNVADPVAAAVPEPMTMSLFAAGLIGAGAMRRRKKAKVA